jgi:uncharacterized protein
VASIVEIAVAPVKGLALERRGAVLLGPSGVVDDRRFYLVDGEGRLANQKRFGALATVVPRCANGRLELAFPGGRTVEGEVRLTEEVRTPFYGRPVAGRLVEGPWNEALTSHVGAPLRLVRAEGPGDGLDRGARAAVTLISTGSLRALAAAAGRETVDGRRFRMLLTVDGLEPHGEDAWVGRRLRAGAAVVELEGNVGRCVVTTRDPATGNRDLPTLDVIEGYRGRLPSSEPLPFGVWGSVLEPGRVALGDAVAPL